MNKVATIDMGSNSFLICISERDSSNPEKIRILEDQARVVGLVKGVQAGSPISEDRIQRAIEVLSDYRKILEKEKDFIAVKAVATEGLRKPSNGEPVRKRLEVALGIPVEMISGEREAELSFWSVQKEFPHPSFDNKIVFDIGGASTEVVHGSKNGIHKSVSLKMGSVLLTEQFNLQSSVENYDDAERFMKEFLEKNCFNIPSETTGIGVAGTMTSLIAVDKELIVYSRDAAHGASINANKLTYWMNKILQMPLQERQDLVGLEPSRADVFGGGLIIAKALCNHFKWKQLTCADSGVRIGLAYELHGL